MLVVLAPCLGEFGGKGLGGKGLGGKGMGKLAGQGGQGLILDRIFDMIGGPRRRFFVEFGFNAPSFETGSGANTYLMYKQGWTGVLLDGRNQKVFWGFGNMKKMHKLLVFYRSTLAGTMSQQSRAVID